ncbi:hypothetical protein GCM10028791_10910 [Echinicola sediminis]
MDIKEISQNFDEPNMRTVDFEPEIGPIENNKKVPAEEVQVLLGDEVFSLLENPEFMAAWEDLYAGCNWATVFQSCFYVKSWYAVFKEENLPVMVMEMDLEGRLSGLLSMAVSKEEMEKGGKVKLFGAGGYEAEYQVWLARGGRQDVFIKKAFERLMDTFPKCSIVFRYVTSRELLNWVDQEKKWKKRCVIQPFMRPLMHSRSPKISEILTPKGQYKSKLGKLKRNKGFSFVRIHGKEQFEEVLGEIEKQFDFRQAAMFNKNQFRDNPAKSNFYRELFEKELLHVTVLKIRNEILASMVALAGKKWVHLQGINTYSPVHSKFSPGMLHFYLLGELLVNEQVETFDLTPGWDSYKEMWTTDSDTVYSLTVTENRSFFFKRFVRKLYHRLLLKMGYRPMSVDLFWIRRKYLFKHKGFWAALKGGSSTFKEREKGREKGLQYFSTNDVGPGRLKGLSIKKNSLEDLLNFEPVQFHMTRWEFMEMAMNNLGRNQNVYTVCSGTDLLAFAWEARVPQGEKKTKEQELLPQGAIVIGDFYCHPSYYESFEHFISATLLLVRKENKNRELFYKVNRTERKLKNAIENIGGVLFEGGEKAGNR